MAYIGNKADTAFTSLLKQDLTGASGASLTLTHAVSNANDIALYINNVRQEPISAYSTNGTVVNLTGSVVSSDDIYVIYLARAVQTTVPPDGSVSTAKIANSAVNLTSKVTGVLPVANGGTGVSSVATDNKGLFQVYSNADQNVANNTTNLVNLNQKVFDLDNYFNTSTYRYTPQVAGYYHIECKLHWRPDNADDNVNLSSYLFKNGVSWHSTGASPYLSGNTTARPIGQMCMKVGAGKEVETEIASLVHFNGSSDYVDLRGYLYNYSSTGNNQMMGHATIMVTYMLGYRVI